MKVREAIRLMEEDGWYLNRTRGNHRQFKHSGKPSLVTIAGKPGDDLLPEQKTVSLSKPDSNEQLPYLIEKAIDGYSAYSPDLPGCVATGSTRQETESEMKEAIEFHIEGLRLNGDKVPQPSTQAAYCEVGA